MTTIREQLDLWVKTTGQQVLTIDGFDDALVGVGTQGPHGIAIAVYSRGKIIEALTEDGMFTYMEAVDFFNYNIQGSWVGEQTPLILFDIEE